MDSTVSVSKGVFVFKNGASRSKVRSGRKMAKTAPGVVASLLDSDTIGQPCYQTYQKIWKSLKTNIDKIQRENYTKTMEDLLLFVQNSYKNNIDNILPAAALLTGINQPDHSDQFETLSWRIREKSLGCAVILQARDCPNVKTTIESMVSGFIDESRCDEDDEEDHDVKSLRRGQYTMHVLESWYDAEHPGKKKALVVIMPGFECFNIQVLQDFILILRAYCERLPIVLVLGVATAVSSLHSSLPYQVSSKMRLKIFQMQSAIVALNEILENVVLAPNCPFHLSGKAFKFLTDTFLFYDFSINGFVQGLKYCLMEHFYEGNAFSLCDNYNESLTKISKLTHSDIESIRRLPSFRPYIEGLKKHPEKVIAFLTDDKYLKTKLPNLLKHCHLFLTIYRCFLELFTTLVEDLPKTPLGRLLREVYSTCVSSNVTDLPEFKESWQMLGFLSKNEFISKFRRALDRTNKFLYENLGSDIIGQECREIVSMKLQKVEELLEKVRNAGMESIVKSTSQQTDLSKFNRHELKEKLLEMSKNEKPVSEFIQSIKQTLEYIKLEIIGKHLLPFNKDGPVFLELFVFSDISSVRRHIVGAPRAALHTALNNPQHYLQCNCCELDNSGSIVATLPDISIAYKLHLESGRMINLFDWLLAFRYVDGDANDDDDSEQIDPQVQARFTRAVAELQFLGYIKTSKKKTDHVTRLTW